MYIIKDDLVDLQLLLRQMPTMQINGHKKAINVKSLIGLRPSQPMRERANEKVIYLRSLAN